MFVCCVCVLLPLNTHYTLHKFVSTTYGSCCNLIYVRISKEKKNKEKPQKNKTMNEIKILLKLVYINDTKILTVTQKRLYTQRRKK